MCNDFEELRSVRFYNDSTHLCKPTILDYKSRREWSMVDKNGLQSKESNYMEDYGFEAKKRGFDSTTGKY